jgi:nucleoid DNA-binding protein
VNAQDLTRAIVRRTGIPHDEVDIVLRTMTQIIHERIGVLEHVWIPGFGKVHCTQTMHSTWRVAVAFSKKTVKAVGADLRPLHDKGTQVGGGQA